MQMIRKLIRLRWAALFACLSATVGCSGSQPRGPGKPVGDSETGVALASRNMPFVIELGNVPTDSFHSKRVRLTNGTSSPILIDRFNASCECTSVVGLPVEVPVGGAGEVTVLTDLAKEPGFTGGLAITVELRSGADISGIVEVHCNVANLVDEKQ
jgi:hypothetical protein